jgi:phosphoribosylformylglycinamidine cyclo-ligase
VNGAMTARWAKEKLITNEKIKAGDVIIGLAGYGKTDYESGYNSGLGSNGLTSARHDVLEKFYAKNFKESFDNSLSDDVVYIGPHKMTDEISIKGFQPNDIGHLLLSPTRTFAPVIKEILQDYFEAVHGMVHCSGGGQTKCLKYVPEDVRIIKDNLFSPPEIFQIIQKASGAEDREMYQVFNMGTRMEIYTNEKDADRLISIAKSFGVNAQVIGRVEAAVKKELVIKVADKEIIF